MSYRRLKSLFFFLVPPTHPLLPLSICASEGKISAFLISRDVAGLSRVHALMGDTGCRV